LTKKIHSLQEDYDKAVSLLEDRDVQLIHVKKRADQVIDHHRVSDAHAWWSYIWHEMKKLGSYHSIPGALTTSSSSASDVAIVEARLKDTVRQQAIELASVRQVCYHKHNTL